MLGIGFLLVIGGLIFWSYNKNSTDLSYNYQCKDGLKRVPWMNYCNKIRNCDDGSDEQKCGEFVIYFQFS
jgi:hypothetical protein